MRNWPPLPSSSHSIVGRATHHRRRSTPGFALALLTVLLCGAPAAVADGWRAHIGEARAYAESRAGEISFGVRTSRGLRGVAVERGVPSASVVKAMLLVAYLREPDVRRRGLQRAERALLGPMIRRSDNAAVSVILPRLGVERVYRLARLAGMTRFHLAWPVWGLSRTSARDQARFFSRLDSYVPARHRDYALRLLRTIVPSQRWGVAQVDLSGWRLYFKGGWGSGTGLVDHQSALLTSGRSRVALSITTRFNPSHEYGKATLRGIARRLVGRLRLPLATPSLLQY
jgi:hypothetical protein